MSPSGPLTSNPGKSPAGRERPSEGTELTPKQESNGTSGRESIREPDLFQPTRPPRRSLPQGPSAARGGHGQAFGGLRDGAEGAASGLSSPAHRRLHVGHAVSTCCMRAPHAEAGVGGAQLIRQGGPPLHAHKATRNPVGLQQPVTPRQKQETRGWGGHSTPEGAKEK